MATPKKVQYKDYAEYLKSPEWREVRAEYSQNEQTEECSCCRMEFNSDDDINPNFHHFRYPKDWNDDSWENLLIVCEDCHRELHDRFKHDSEPISLRAYFFKMQSIIEDRCEEYISTISRDSLWCGSGGDFCITQKGISSRKEITLTTTLCDQQLIGWFEDRRDHRLAEKKKK
jgi:hypothetical protein